MTVQDLVNALLQFPPTMEIFTIRDDFSKTIEKYTTVDDVEIGNAAIKSEQDKEGNDVLSFKQAVLIKVSATNKEIKK